MYPVTISHTASHPNERRRNPRHRAPFIIYVQLSSGIGGIVVNLGMDGVAFHAAQKLTAEKNSTLNLKLRGSGLNADLVGELVWVSATQKEAGIRFENLSSDAQRDIADWIAREAQVFEPVAMEEPLRPKLMPATPGNSAGGEKSAPHSLSPALAASRATPADTAPKTDVDANESHLRAPLDSVAGISSAMPLLEIVSPPQHRNVPADRLDEHLQGRIADSPALPEQNRFARPLHDQGLFEPVPIDQPYQFPGSYSSPIVRPKEAMQKVSEELPAATKGTSDQSKLGKTKEKEEMEAIPVQSLAGNFSPILPSEEPMPAVRGELRQGIAEPAVKSRFGKTENFEQTPKDRVSLPTNQLLEAGILGKWIPPALLLAWRRGDRQRKLTLAGTGLAGIGVFALLFALGLAHIESSVGQTAERAFVQQSPAQQFSPPQSVVLQSGSPHSSAPPAASIASVDPPQAGPVQPPPVPPATVPQQAQQPAASLLASLASNLLGIETDSNTPITEQQTTVQVWTSQRSGYYYCTDSDYYKTVQPGAFMAQEDALQSGYRPRLRQFCN